MNYPYQMKDLTSIVNKTPQAIYVLIKHNQELSSIVKDNSSKRGRLTFYGQAVLDWLIKHYQVEIPAENAPAGQVGEPDAQEIPEPTPPGTASQTADVSGELAELRQEVQRLTEENERLRRELAEKTSLWQEERALRQDVWTMLKMEKAEKHAFLPQLRKPLLERIRGFFKPTRAADAVEIHVESEPESDSNEM